MPDWVIRHGPPAEAVARAELVANAERKGADAVAKVVCRKEL